MVVKWLKILSAIQKIIQNPQDCFVALAMTKSYTLSMNKTDCSIALAMTEVQVSLFSKNNPKKFANTKD